LAAYLWTIFVLFAFPVASEPLPGAANVACNGNQVCFLRSAATSKPGLYNVGDGYEVKGWTEMEFIRKCQLLTQTYSVPTSTKIRWGDGPRTISCHVLGVEEVLMWMVVDPR